MPRLRRRSKGQHVKVYRPEGARFAQAGHSNIGSAINNAMTAFANEFGAIPKQEETVIEIVGATGVWLVTIYEIPEPDEVHAAPLPARGK